MLRSSRSAPRGCPRASGVRRVRRARTTSTVGWSWRRATSWTGTGEIVESLELMPEPMFRALEDVVGLVVDGEYEELRAASGDRLGVEDLRRRVEDDCPESLVLPPREIYQVEAVAKSDDPELPGWAYFLDLWTETGPARLHIEGELEESGERFTATLNDILP